MLLPQSEHVLLEVFESLLMYSPCPQVGCGVQEVMRCELDDWKVLLGQLEHVGTEAPLPSNFSPGPQVIVVVVVAVVLVEVLVVAVAVVVVIVSSTSSFLAPAAQSESVLNLSYGPQGC